MTLDRLKESVRTVGVISSVKMSIQHVIPVDLRKDYVRNHIQMANADASDGGITAVEVGVWRGEHAETLINQLDVETLYLVDPYEIYEDYNDPYSDNPDEPSDIDVAKADAKDRLGRYDCVEWVYEPSQKGIEHLPDGLDYVYIDANHDYEYAKADIQSYYDRLRPGGIVAGHDFSGSHCGVVRAVVEVCDEKGLKFHTEWGMTDWYIKKQP